MKGWGPSPPLQFPTPSPPPGKTAPQLSLELYFCFLPSLFIALSPLESSLHPSRCLETSSGLRVGEGLASPGRGKEELSPTPLSTAPKLPEAHLARPLPSTHGRLLKDKTKCEKQQPLRCPSQLLKGIKHVISLRVSQEPTLPGPIFLDEETETSGNKVPTAQVFSVEIPWLWICYPWDSDLKH